MDQIRLENQRLEQPRSAVRRGYATLNARPTIIIGMHRSGTGLVMRSLADLGLFVGWRTDLNSESLFFQRVNKWILRQCGGSWDHPTVVRDLLASPDDRSVVVEHLRFLLRSRHAVSHFGSRMLDWLRRGTLGSTPWGWKDPRNTFTLPLWLDVFPDARVIHVCRHGVDVAQSLVHRSESSRLRRLSRFRNFEPLYGWWWRRGGVRESYRCRSLEGGLALWREYVDAAQRHVAALGDRAIEIRYEDLLREPEKWLRELAAFAGLECDAATIERVARRVEPSRAFAYRADDKLTEFADRAANVLTVLGYSV